MKKYFFIVFLIIFISCSNREEPNSGMKRVLEDLYNSDADLSIIPYPDSLVKFDKGKFQMNAKTKIFTSVETISEAYYMLSFIKGKPNNIRYRLDGVQENLDEYGIYLLIDSEMDGDEAYQLKITENYVKISANSEKGVFYGIQSLRQLMPDIAEEQDAGSENELITYVKRGVLGNNMTVPYCEIYDRPRFKFRGMQLDVSRHFFSVKEVKTYIDILAMHKINYFIWHLSDDQGWRVEIKSFPELTKIGAKRQETMLGKNFDPFKGDGEEYFHFYTQQEIREVVEYAKDRHVEIIPEISFPGHAAAILAAYPGLGGQKGYSVKTTWGDFEDYIYPTSESLSFFRSVYREMQSLFPGDYFQLAGIGEEKNFTKQQDLKDMGFKTTADIDWFFINNLKPWMESFGRKVIIRDVNTDRTKSPSDVVLLNDTEASKSNNTNEFILGNKNYLNFSTYPSKLNKDQISFGGYINTKDVYLFDEINNQYFNIIGAEASLSSEYIGSNADLHYQLLPRLSAYSEILWTPDENMNWFNFKSRFRANLQGKFKKRGYRYSDFF